ncbi:MAG: head-tail connector protein [Alphaproteobacteria bacterium]|nr:head-tail connector protein [Alphaproteobacteria bacterium]
MTHISQLYRRYQQAVAERSVWEPTWQECYQYAFPQRESVFRTDATKTTQLYDGTAPDAVDQLGALMLSQLTPPWMNWFQLNAGAELSKSEQNDLAPTLEKMTQIIQGELDRSNFAMEIHQCYLDLITVGTACLMFEESPFGAASAFKFTAVPLSQLCLAEGTTGRLDHIFRSVEMDVPSFIDRFGEFVLPPDVLIKAEKENIHLDVIECVEPMPDGSFAYTAFLNPDCQYVPNDGEPIVLKTACYDTSPFIAFRWLKAPGEVYGRSPVMKALPDIKTANKVVELILKNATIAVTGIWLAEDDGVLNPANIRLTPGAIIPKAVGSKGLTALESPGKFDVSQLVIKDLREHIRHALLGDKLGQLDAANPMTATEVMERADDMILVLGATYGRLQSELLMPLIDRAISLLRKRGALPDIYLDGHYLTITYQSGRAQKQAKTDAENALTWLSEITKFGNEALSQVDVVAFMKWLGQKLNVPASLMRTEMDAPLIPLQQPNKGE